MLKSYIKQDAKVIDHKRRMPKVIATYKINMNFVFARKIKWTIPYLMCVATCEL